MPRFIQKGLVAREKIIAKVFEKYENKLKEANALDFDDLLFLLLKF